MSYGDVVALATMARDSKVEAERVHAQMERVMEDFVRRAALLSAQLKWVELERERVEEQLKTQLKSVQLGLDLASDR